MSSKLKSQVTNMNNSLRVIGIDQQRPPQVRKEAYIDIVFKLSDKAPEGWIDIFNTLGRTLDPSVKMDKTGGNFIVAWVRTMDEIPGHFGKIKQKVEDSNKQYEEKIQQQLLAAQNYKESAASQQQTKLNAIIASLDFD